MAEDIDARLARLRHAAYGPGAAPGPEELAELAELERQRAGTGVVGRLTDDEVATSEADSATAGLSAATHDNDARASTPDIPRDTRAAEQSTDAVPQPAAQSIAAPVGRRRASILRRPWAVLAAAVVATGLITSVAGYAVGSQRPTDAAAVAEAKTQIDEAVGTTAWFGESATTNGWDVDTARLLGTVGDVSVLVTTKQDGEQWCGVLVRKGAFVEHVESCRRSETGVVGLQFALGPSVQVRRAVDGTYTFDYVARQVTRILDGPLAVARDLLVATLGWPQDEVISGGMFEGVSVWGVVDPDGSMCIAFVRSALREVEEAGCDIFEDAKLSITYTLADSSGDSSTITLSVQRIGDHLVTRADIGQG